MRGARVILAAALPLLLAASPVSDLNRDGVIRLGEFITRIDALFAKADTDFDGRLSREEEQSLDRNFAEANAADRFRLADADGNNQLSEREWMSTVQTPTELMYNFPMGGAIRMMEKLDQSGSTEEERNARFQASLQAYSDRTKRARTRARAITNMPEEPRAATRPDLEPEPELQPSDAPAASPNPSDRSLITALDSDPDAGLERGEVFGFAVHRSPKGGRTRQVFRKDMIFNFLMLDTDEDERLSLGEWQDTGLFTR